MKNRSLLVNFNYKDILLAIIVLAVLVVLMQSKSTFTVKRAPSFSEAFFEPIDSVKVTESRVEVFTKKNRIKIDVVNHIKYYRASDTTITVYDTSGFQIGNSEKAHALKPIDHKIIKNILIHYR